MPRISHKCVGTLLSFKKFGLRVTENIGHLYHEGKITAIVRDLRLSLYNSKESAENKIYKTRFEFSETKKKKLYRTSAKTIPNRD